MMMSDAPESWVRRRASIAPERRPKTSGTWKTSVGSELAAESREVRRSGLRGGEAAKPRSGPRGVAAGGSAQRGTSGAATGGGGRSAPDPDNDPTASAPRPGQRTNVHVLPDPDNLHLTSVLIAFLVCMPDKATIDGLLEGAIDTHVHSAPDVLPRKFDDLELAQRFKARRLAGFVLK